MDALWITAAFLATLPISLLALYGAHLALTRWIYLPSAKRFARRLKLQPVRWHCQPALSERGTKTEYSIVRLDCLDEAGRERTIDVLVWAFGAISELPVAARANASS